jgi:hypothetical protein
MKTFEQYWETKDSPHLLGVSPEFIAEDAWLACASQYESRIKDLEADRDALESKIIAMEDDRRNHHGEGYHQAANECQARIEDLEAELRAERECVDWYASTSSDYPDHTWETDNSYDPDRYVIRRTDREWIENVGEVGGKRARARKAARKEIE